ncbi:MAG: transglycosylase domain-containing protein, partial [Deltaproteobacteria bacterium]|nr:transglycosylase domain-containing protein [Deltaproteobacteria bacterium]
VALGTLVSVDAIEASVAMSSLLGGQLRADEIRVDGPRVAIEIDAHGDSDLARMARRLAHRGAGTSKKAKASGVRRIIVAQGSFKAQIARVGELTAEGVELVPDATGVRVITGPIRIARAHSPVHVDLAFARSAAELRLPAMQFGRVLAVGGTGKVAVDRKTVALRDVAAGRLAADGVLELRGALVDTADSGVPRAVAATVSPSDLAVRLTGEHVPLAVFGSLLPRSLDVSHAHATGAVMVRKTAARLELAVDGKIDGLVVDHKNLSTTPLPITATLAAEITISPEAIAIPKATLQTGDAKLVANGWIRRNGPVSGQLEAQLQSAPCQSLLASLPFRGPLDGMALSGELGARARLSVDLAAPAGEGTNLDTSFTGNCTVVAEPPEADVMSLTRDSEQQLADGTRAMIGKNQASWANLKALPYHVPAAFISAEDGRFWEHAGFDVEQIARSLEIDLRERRLARGGSTISQQLIKNAFLTRNRTLDRKLQEAVLTWRLEERLDKKQILERYLNILELGPRVFGVRAAAQYWFNLSPRELGVKQAAFLAALTSQPTSMSRRIRKTGGLDPDSAERVATVLRAMRRDGVIGTEEFDLARVAGMGFASSALRE